MIYLAYSKAPSNETSSRRAQSSASSSIERTFRTSGPKQQFLSLDRLPSVSTRPTPLARRLNRQSLDLQREFFGNSEISPDWRRLHLSFSPDRRAKASQAKRNRITFNATLGASSKTATPGNVTHLLSLLLLLTKQKKTPTLLSPSQPTILILMIVTLSTKIL